MSHHIYQTNAFVLSSTIAGEANKTLLLFTEELGVLYVAAQGVRLQKSKLKASIQDYSYTRVCLVKGKEVWRLTSAQKLISLYDRRLPIEARKALARTLQFVQRMSPGEGRQKDLFDVLTGLCNFIFQRKALSPSAKVSPGPGSPGIIDFFHAASLLARLRILHVLGYGSGDEEMPKAFSGTAWDDEVVNSAFEQKAALEKHIERALRESHL